MFIRLKAEFENANIKLLELENAICDLTRFVILGTILVSGKKIYL